MVHCNSFVIFLQIFFPETCFWVEPQKVFKLDTGQHITVSKINKFLIPPVPSEILCLWPVRPAVLLEKQSNHSDKGRKRYERKALLLPPSGINPT